MTLLAGRSLPNGCRVSLLGLGTVRFGRMDGLRLPGAGQLPDPETLFRLLEHARGLGINLLDTAPAYGVSEARLGELLCGQRQDWVLSGKAGETRSRGQSLFAFDQSSLRRSLEESLARLKTDYLDMVWIHSDGRDLEILQKTDAVPTLLQAREEGLVHLVGASVKTVAGGLLSLDLLDLVMCTHNLRVQAQLPVLQKAGEGGARRALIKKPLDSGQLGNRFAEALQFAAGSPGVASLVLGSLSREHLTRAAECLAGSCS